MTSSNCTLYEISLHVDLHNARLKKRREPDAQGPTLFANLGRVVSSGRVFFFFFCFFCFWDRRPIRPTRPRLSCLTTILGLSMVRYVGVIQFLFQVLQLWPVRFTQQNLCWSSKSIMKHHQKLSWNLDFSLFSYGYHKCTFVGFVTKYICSPIIGCGVVKIIWMHSPIFSNHVSLLFGGCSLNLTKPLSNIGT